VAEAVTQLGAYKVGELIREEPLAAFYRGGDAQGREVDLVILRGEGLAIDAPDAEARLGAALAPVAGVRGPKVVAFLDMGRADDQLYLVRERCDWPTLRDLLDRQRRADLDATLGVAAAVSETLDAFAQVGTDHGDLRPENILVAPEGRVRLDGHDLARAVRALARDEAQRLQHAEYLSPEQASGAEQDIRSDFYALGVVLYEALTGEVPFRGDTLFATARQHILAPAPSVTRLRPQLPAAVAQLVERCLAKRPEDRFQTPGELATALAALEPAGRAEAPRGSSQTMAINREELERARAQALESAQAVAAAAAEAPARPAEAPIQPAEAPPPAADLSASAVPAPVPAAGGSRAALYVVIAIVVAIVLIVVLAIGLKAAGVY
jgi:serine/threonine-protein kinase